jgi:lipopolysaccharide transport system permease protein
MSAIIETSRYMFLGSGSVPLLAMLYSATFSVIVFLLGVVIFNRTEKNFMDTV